MKINRHNLVGRRGTPLERFERKIEKTDDCWNWIAGKNPKGYGLFNPDGTVVLATRYSYEVYKTPITDGLWVLHRCDNPACVNPEHLFLGTAKDNVQDMLVKGRNKHARGEAHRKATLTDEEVALFRTELSLSDKDLCVKYKVSKATANKIRNNKTRTQNAYQHID